MSTATLSFRCVGCGSLFASTEVPGHYTCPKCNGVPQAE